MHQILLPSSRLRRTLESFRHPDQAAVAARLPIVGDRVPMSRFWRRQKVQPRRVLHNGSHSAARLTRNAAHEASHGARRASRAVREGVRTSEPVVRGSASQLRRLGVPALAAAALGGILLMFFLDPASGRRRRALTRDRVSKLAHTTTRVPRRLGRRGRFVRGVARGVQHGVSGRIGSDHRLPIDDETLVARVRSEALRGRDVHPGEINIDAYEGVVTLRGQLRSDAEVKRIVQAAKHIDGVREVRSYLHLPGTPPPNKAEIFEKGRVPAHLAPGGA